MAIIVKFVCTVCRHTREEPVGSGKSNPMVCYRCKKLELDCERRLHFQGLAGLTIEERLHKIELWMYNHSKLHESIHIEHRF